MDRAFAPVAEAVERHETSLVDHEGHLKSLDLRFEAQQAAVEQLRSEEVALRSEQSVAEETVREVCKEMAMPPDAPPPPLPCAAGGWDRVVEPNVLQANGGAMFSAEALVASLTLLAEATNLVVKERDARTAARRAGTLTAGFATGGWRKVEVTCAAGGQMPLYISPHKKPRTVKTEGTLSVGYQKVVRICTG